MATEDGSAGLNVSLELLVEVLLGLLRDDGHALPGDGRDDTVVLAHQVVLVEVVTGQHADGTDLNAEIGEGLQGELDHSVHLNALLI